MLISSSPGADRPFSAATVFGRPVGRPPALALQHDADEDVEASAASPGLNQSFQSSLSLGSAPDSDAMDVSPHARPSHAVPPDPSGTGELPVPAALDELLDGPDVSTIRPSMGAAVFGSTT